MPASHRRPCGGTRHREPFARCGTVGTFFCAPCAVPLQHGLHEGPSVWGLRLDFAPTPLCSPFRPVANISIYPIEGTSQCLVQVGVAELWGIGLDGHLIEGIVIDAPEYVREYYGSMASSIVSNYTDSNGQAIVEFQFDSSVVRLCVARVACEACGVLV